MNAELFLPAVVLPNQENDQDAIAIVQGGTKLRMAELLQRLGPTHALRFMINSNDPQQPQAPRLTWQKLADGQVIISASFEYGIDNYSRVTSAAVVFMLSQGLELASTVPDVLPKGLADAVFNAISARQEDVANFIDVQTARGKSGGEIGELKKKFRGLHVLTSLGVMLLLSAAVVWYMMR